MKTLLIAATAAVFAALTITATEAKEYTGEEAAILLAGFELTDASREEKDLFKKLLVGASKVAALYASLEDTKGGVASYLPEIKAMAPECVAAIFPGIKPAAQRAFEKNFYTLVEELLRREGFIG